MGWGWGKGQVQGDAPLHRVECPLVLGCLLVRSLGTQRGRLRLRLRWGEGCGCG